MGWCGSRSLFSRAVIPSMLTFGLHALPQWSAGFNKRNRTTSGKRPFYQFRKKTEPLHQRSFIGQGCLRPCMVVGEGRGVYARPFAVSGSRVENEVTEDQPEAARIESWV